MQTLKTALIVLILSLLVAATHSFVLKPRATSEKPTVAFGIAEWREHAFNDNNEATKSKTSLLLLLPFSVNETLVQGQSTSIVLKEGRFFDLFQDCIDDFHSVIGMALVGDDGFLDTLPLCEIDDFDVQAGYRGKVIVSVTLRAVGRAALTELKQLEPISMGVCRELVDEPMSPDDVVLVKDLMDDIRNIVQDLSRRNPKLENQYDEAFNAALATLEHRKEHSIAPLTATSFAIFAAVQDPSFYQQAMASVNLIERLQLGRKALLNAKFKLSSSRMMDGFSRNREADDATPFE